MTNKHMRRCPTSLTTGEKEIKTAMRHHFTATKKTMLKKKGDFPGGPVVKNLPANAGGTGSIPGLGTKIPHAMGQLNPCTTTTEPMP